MKRLVLIALVVAACSGQPAPGIPWDSDIPEGGRLVYHVDSGLGWCSTGGCPTRIIDVDGICITETWRGHWEFRESKPCTSTPA